MTIARLTRVTAQTGCRLRLEYDDGASGEVDLSELIGKGVFAPLDDKTLFEAVSIGPHGEVRWSDEMELCADALYLQLTGKAAEDVFPNLRAHANA